MFNVLLGLVFVVAGVGHVRDERKRGRSFRASGALALFGVALALMLSVFRAEFLWLALPIGFVGLLMAAVARRIPVATLLVRALLSFGGLLLILPYPVLAGEPVDGVKEPRPWWATASLIAGVTCCAAAGLIVLVNRRRQTSQAEPRR